jgi:hypothetical protein
MVLGMKQFGMLFAPAYGVTLIAVPVAMVLDHLGRGATPLRAMAVLPLWVCVTSLFALPFVLAAAGLALLLRKFSGHWLSGNTGRLAFTIICGSLGAVIMKLTIQSYALVAAAAGGTAAWVSSSPDWPPGWRHSLTIAVGLVAGVVLGLRYY